MYCAKRIPVIRGYLKENKGSVTYSVSWSVMEMDIGMFSQPTIMFGFMGIQVIQHNMQFCFRIIV